MLARRFLYLIAGLIVLTLAAGIGWTLFQDQLMRLAFVPGVRFNADGAGPPPDYARPAAWLSRPDLPDDPARWLPKGETRAARPEVAVFYVPPTTYFGKASWNAALDDTDSRKWLRVFGQSEASAFNGVGAIWAPRYRSATLGAFMSKAPDSARALDLAYGDVARAFEAFLGQIPASRPIILAGHSQGTVHLMRLLHERIADRPVARRIVAAYLVGWPVSVDADVPALGLPACHSPRQAGCLLSWQSFGEPADPRAILDIYNDGHGYADTPRRGTRMLCINPLTGAPDTAALPAANLGSLVPSDDFMDGELRRGAVPARCDASGLLLIGGAPKGFGRFVMPGNNYHVFDYALFWANIRADAAARAKTFLQR